MKLFLSLSLALLLSLFGLSCAQDEDSTEEEEEETETPGDVNQTEEEERQAEEEAEAAQVIYEPAQQFIVEYEYEDEGGTKVKDSLFVVYQNKADKTESYIFVAQHYNATGRGSRATSQAFIKELIPQAPGTKRAKCSGTKIDPLPHRLWASVSVLNPAGKATENLTGGIDDKLSADGNSSQGHSSRNIHAEGYTVRSVILEGGVVKILMLEKAGGTLVTAKLEEGSVASSDLPLGQYVDLLKFMNNPQCGTPTTTPTPAEPAERTSPAATT